VRNDQAVEGNASANGHDPVLRADTVSIGYGQRIVVEDLSLELMKGGITALVGPNGSGKSTLLKTLARLLKPSTGEI
jgi:iron complex transport system ATP-binding protein